MARYKCTIIVDVEDEKLSKLMYDSADDYLNDCDFNVLDYTGDDICCEVREYEEIVNG